MASPELTDMKDRLKWTAEQDAQLVSAVAKVSSENNEINWHRVADYLPKRTNKDCRKRWHYQIAREIRKGQWTREEDQRLLDAVQKHGTKWHKVSGEVGTRNGDQCWKRWNDNLDPSINHGPWNGNEDALLLESVQTMGRNWSDIVGKFLPGRTALAAKNRFTLLSRRAEHTPISSKASNGDLKPGSISAPSPSSSSPSSSSLSLSSNSSSSSISPSSSSTSLPLSPSLVKPHEDEGLNFLDIDIEALPMEMSISGDLDYDANLMTYFMDPIPPTAPECSSYPTPSSALSPTSYRYPHPQLSDSPEYNFDNDLCQSPLRDIGTDQVSRDQYQLSDGLTKELVIRVRCRAGRTEAIMEGLTKVVNGLMVQGDVRDVNFSIA